MGRAVTYAAVGVSGALILLALAYLVRQSRQVEVASNINISQPLPKSAAVASSVPNPPARKPPTVTGVYLGDKPADLPLAPEAIAAAVPASISRWISDWEKNELGGRGATDDEIHSLRELIVQENLPAL